MKLLSLVVVVAVAAAPLVVRAEDVVPVGKGVVAPYTGLLLPESYFTELLEAEDERDDLKGKLRLEKKYSEDMEKLYKEKLHQAAKEQEWHETPTFNRWLGFMIGVVVTGLAIWGGVAVVKATNGQ